MNGDWCTNDGAERLKRRIKTYWHERGYDVDVDLVDAGFVPSMRSGRTDVRSDMINGMPTKRPERRETNMPPELGSTRFSAIPTSMYG